MAHGEHRVLKDLSNGWRASSHEWKWSDDGEDGIDRCDCMMIVENAYTWHMPPRAVAGESDIPARW
jgi:hypothetical protein